MNDYYTKHIITFAYPLTLFSAHSFAGASACSPHVSVLWKVLRRDLVSVSKSRSPDGLDTRFCNVSVFMTTMTCVKVSSRSCPEQTTERIHVVSVSDRNVSLYHLICFTTLFFRSVIDHIANNIFVNNTACRSYMHSSSASFVSQNHKSCVVLTQVLCAYSTCLVLFLHTFNKYLTQLL